ncbi:hypothetical protein [Capnocytophaga sp. oral taxon 878]|nr:hypothetical protein [Capnocytophaga sp. oral taxon 878]
MTKILFYGYFSNIYSFIKIAQVLNENICFYVTFGLYYR